MTSIVSVFGKHARCALNVIQVEYYMDLLDRIAECCKAFKMEPPRVLQIFTANPGEGSGYVIVFDRNMEDFDKETREC